MEAYSDYLRGRKPLWLLLACFGLPLLTALVLHLVGAETFFTQGGSHGILIEPPRKLPAIPVLKAEGGQHDLRELLRGRWGLLYFLPNVCERSCHDDLEQLQRAHLLAGRDPQRLVRVLLTDSPKEIGTIQVSKHPEAEIMLVRDALGRARPLFDSLIPQDDKSMRAPRLLIVDPQGVLVSAYTHPVSWQGLLKDLQRLLRYSWTG
jgi:hypothetical protein